MADEHQGLPTCLSGKQPAFQCRRPRTHRFNPWVGKIPWRRTWQPTAVFLPGGSCGQRSLAGYSPRGCTELETSGRLSTHSCRRASEPGPALSGRVSGRPPPASLPLLCHLGQVALTHPLSWCWGWGPSRVRSGLGARGEGGVLRRGRGSFSGAKWQTTLMVSRTDSTRDPALAAPPAPSAPGDRAAVGVRGAVNTQEHTPCSGSGGCWGWSGHRA